MRDLRVLIAAAGTGSRAGLPYPKTLHPVRGRPILLSLLDRVGGYDPEPTIIVSPSGKELIEEALKADGKVASLVVQERPSGMGDAVLAFRHSPRFDPRADVLLAWGDIPLLDQATIAACVERHRTSDNAMTFASRLVDQAYTRVARDGEGRVTALEETRELGIEPVAGERDIGLFVFRAGPILDLLKQFRSEGLGKQTGEHGFLYIVAKAAAAGLLVEALPIATEQDCISLNRLSDLDQA
ncbi:NTP transferase domain-containing protein [Sphingomonas humi]|uniref:MobA-like NTP transferase domain-containing protein n=1 Tax=Sphingomonas humi TaxID=335630 RepID=A0ABP7SDU7_9SPHN